MLDVGALAAGRPRQYQLGLWAVSPNNKRVAFTVDFNGDRKYRVFVRTLPTGEVVDEGLANAASSLVFAGDSETLFYVRNEPTTVRSYQVWRHRIASDTTSDVLIYEEKDPTFSVSLDLSKSRKFMLLNIEGERTSEVRYLAVDQPSGDLEHRVRWGDCSDNDCLSQRPAPHRPQSGLDRGLRRVRFEHAPHLYAVCFQSARPWVYPCHRPCARRT